MNKNLLSTSTFFAAGVVCLVQISLKVLNVLFFFIAPFVFPSSIIDQKIRTFFVQQGLQLVNNIFITAISLLLLGVAGLLLFAASKAVRKHDKVQMWSIIGLVAASIVMSFSSLAGFLGAIGAVAGLMIAEASSKNTFPV